MISVIQLVSTAQVVIDDINVGSINHGIVALVGIEKTDTTLQAEKLFDKIIHYRIFQDSNGKTNLSLLDIQGGLLLVPQFTLLAETNKGTRPGFSKGMPPEEGKKIFEYLVEHARKHYANIACGKFGAYMKVSLCNNGPMTFILEV